MDEEAVGFRIVFQALETVPTLNKKLLLPFEHLRYFLPMLDLEGTPLGKVG